MVFVGIYQRISRFIADLRIHVVFEFTVSPDSKAAYDLFPPVSKYKKA